MATPHSPHATHHTLGRQERIKSSKLIDELFSGGKSQSMAAFPLRVVWSIKEQDSPLTTQILVSVSKRHFKRAVKRNRVKRQIREAYRLNKQLLTSSILHSSPSTLCLAFIWQSDELFPSSVVEERMRTLLQRLAEKLSLNRSPEKS